MVLHPVDVKLACAAAKLFVRVLCVQGFLPNVRQQRAAGYAALQLAQTVRALLAERAAGREGLWVNR